MAYDLNDSLSSAMLFNVLLGQTRCLFRTRDKYVFVWQDFGDFYNIKYVKDHFSIRNVNDLLYHIKLQYFIK